MKTANPFTKEEEEGLVRKMQDEDENAFERLMKEYYQNYIKGICLRMIPNQHILDDVVNLVMINIWRKSHLFAFRSSFSTWVHAVTFNTTRNAIKKEKCHWKGRNCIESDDMIDPILMVACKRNRPDQNLMYKEIAYVVRHSLPLLSEQHRRIISLTGSGLDCQQIATICNIPPGTVRTQLYYARRRIRNDLLEAGLWIN